MLNRLLNSATAWYVQRSFRSYHHYPADRTAVVFIDVQNAFIAGSPTLATSLASLAQLERTRGFLVIHAKMAAVSNTRHPTPALLEIERLLSGEPDSSDIAAAIGPVYADVVLPERSTLSIFGSPEVDELIDSRGLEHLVLAGPLADVTVDSSLRDAVQRDLHVTVVSDCVAASTKAALELELRYTMPRYAHLITDLEALERLTGL